MGAGEGVGATGGGGVCGWRVVVVVSGLCFGRSFVMMCSVFFF